MLRSHRHQAGFSLVELMVASVISLTAMAAMIVVYTSNLQHASRQLGSAILHQQLHGIVHLFTSDIRRAGYRAFDPAMVSPVANPFQSSELRTRVSALAGEAGQSCILYTYDLDRDGKVGIGRCPASSCDADYDDSNEERFGLRLRDGQVQSRLGGNELDCNNGYWQAITDSAVEVTGLKFHIVDKCTPLDPGQVHCGSGEEYALQQAVLIELNGQLRGRPDTAISLSRLTGIRNRALYTGAGT